MLRIAAKKPDRSQYRPVEEKIFEVSKEPDPPTKDEIQQIESELFGNIDEQFVKPESLPGAPLFTIDRGEKRAVWNDDDEEDRDIDLGSGNICKKLRVGDADDAVTGRELETKLRAQFKKIHGTPAWTSVVKKKQSLLATTGNMTAKSSTLPTKKLSVSRCKNLNGCRIAPCAVQSVDLHPRARVGLVAGFSKTLNLFEVDGQNNKHLHGQHFAKYPICKAAFTANGTEVILGSKRPFFYTFDLETCTATKIAGIRNCPNVHFQNFTQSEEYLGFLGQEGRFAVFSADDKQLVRCLTHKQRIHSALFLDSKTVVTAGHGGFCTLWDVRTWKPLHDFRDEGSLRITSISKSASHIAMGSESGVVNIYNVNDVFNTHAKPLKSVMNLTTDVDHTAFNSSGELLAMSSKVLKHSLKLVNLHNLQCVPNWPTSKTPLAYVTSVKFSPNSGYLAMGNTKGKVLLYQLTHYDSY